MAQNYHFVHYGSKEGLLSDKVSCVGQDKLGFIWIGTNKGLQRFDGKEFKNWFATPGDTTSVFGNTIAAIATDSFGNLWVTSEGGLSQYDYSNGHFRHAISGKKLGNPEGWMSSLCASRMGGLWFGDNTGINYRLPQTKDSVWNYPFPKDRGSYITDIMEDANGTVWLTTLRGLFYLDVHLNQLVEYPELDVLGNEHINALGLLQNDSGRLWMGTWGSGLREIFPHEQRSNAYMFEPPPTDRGTFTHDIATSLIKWQENILLASCAGVYEFSPSTKTFRALPLFPEEVDKKSEVFARSFFKSSEGIVWIATDQGLFVLDPSLQRFPSYRMPYRGMVRDIEPDIERPGWMYLLAWLEPVTSWNPTTGESERLWEGNEQAQGIMGGGYHLKYDGFGTLWATSVDALLNLKNGKAFRNNPQDSTSFPKFGVRSMAKIRGGGLWLATSGGLYAFDPIKSSFRKVNSEGTHSIATDSSGIVWGILNKNGYFKYDPATNITTIIPDTTHYEPEYIIVAHDGMAWASNKYGLTRIELGTLKVEHFISTQEHPISRCRWLVEGPDGGIWCSNWPGISVFYPSSREWRMYNDANGLADMLEFVPYIGALGNGQLIYAPDNFYANIFSPITFPKIDFPPPIVFSYLKINGTEINTRRKGNSIEPLSVSWKDNYLEFGMAALCYSNPEKNRFFYRLLGDQTDWIDNGNHNAITFYDLAPGHYTLEVKAVNGDGVWSKSPVSISIYVSPPFWQTWWFYLFCALSVVAIFYAFYQNRVRRLLELLRLRNAISRDLHDEVGSTLSSISILSTLAQRTAVSNPSKTQELNENISNSASKMLEAMDDIVWTVNPKNDPFGNMVTRMNEYLVNMLEAKGIEAEVLFDDKLRKLNLPMDARKNIYLIFKEAINNMAKYSQATKATIQFEQVGRFLSLTISDNGIGFDATKVKQGNGLSNLKQRAAALGGELRIESEPGKGTLVVMSYEL